MQEERDLEENLPASDIGFMIPSNAAISKKALEQKQQLTRVI